MHWNLKINNLSYVFVFEIFEINFKFSLQCWVVLTFHSSIEIFSVIQMKFCRNMSIRLTRNWNSLWKYHHFFFTSNLKLRQSWKKVFSKIIVTSMLVAIKMSNVSKRWILTSLTIHRRFLLLHAIYAKSIFWNFHFRKKKLRIFLNQKTNVKTTKITNISKLTRWRFNVLSIVRKNWNSCSSLNADMYLHDQFNNF